MGTELDNSGQYSHSVWKILQKVSFYNIWKINFMNLAKFFTLFKSRNIWIFATKLQLIFLARKFKIQIVNSKVDFGAKIQKSYF